MCRKTVHIRKMLLAGIAAGLLSSPWTLYATGWVQILATPVIAITLLLIMDKILSVTPKIQ